MQMKLCCYIYLSNYPTWCTKFV